MSLGLQDLKKRPRANSTKANAEAATPVASAKTTNARAAQAKSVDPQATKEKYPAGAWSKSTTARPWSNAGLSQPKPKSRKKTEFSDSIVNDDWIPLGASGESRSPLSCLHERLAAVEEKIKTALEGPLAILRLVLRDQK